MPNSNAQDTTPSVRIPLLGKRGQDCFVTVDAADWQHVRETWGDAWTRNLAGHVVYGGPGKAPNG